MAGCDCFAQAKRKEKRRLLGQTVADVEAIVGEFWHDSCVNAQPSFRSLKRQLPGQRVAASGADGGWPAVLLGDSWEAAADSLQAPHDTGATCSGYKNKGRAARPTSPKSCGTTKNNKLEPTLHLGLYTESCRRRHVSDVFGVEPLAAQVEKTGIHPEVTLVVNACNSPTTARSPTSAALTWSPLSAAG
ncbi:MAG: hypothetical protein LBQ12_09825 [Deltaproteobacteria bacterium]|nr:hypothetical protein [Deltaproteobacteria bacterium]